MRTWVDKIDYFSGEIESSTLNLPRLNIVVHRRNHLHRMWLVSCVELAENARLLRAPELGSAKDEAVRYIATVVGLMVKDLQLQGVEPSKELSMYV